jgi:hypothetical protein
MTEVCGVRAGGGIARTRDFTTAEQPVRVLAPRPVRQKKILNYPERTRVLRSGLGILLLEGGGDIGFGVDGGG